MRTFADENRAKVRQVTCLMSKFVHVLSTFCPSSLVTI